MRQKKLTSLKQFSFFNIVSLYTNAIGPAMFQCLDLILKIKIPPSYLQNTPQLRLSVHLKTISTHQGRYSVQERDGSLMEPYQANKVGVATILSQFLYFCHVNNTCAGMHCPDGTRLSSLMKLAFLCISFALVGPGCQLSIVFYCNCLTSWKIICQQNPFHIPENFKFLWGGLSAARPTPTRRTRSPYLYPQETGSPSYAPEHWELSLVAFYDMHELQWDYSYPVTTRGIVYSIALQ